MSKAIFAGLDIETTGTEFAKHSICQIGVQLFNGPLFVSDVRERRIFVSDPKAMEVNGFTEERCMNAPLADIVDAKLCVFMAQQEAQLGHDLVLVPVGWNVGAFDMPYVRRALPCFSEYVTRRSVDLNAVCFTAADMLGMKFDALKKHVKRAAAADMTATPIEVNYAGERWKAHDAGWDARNALACWYQIKRAIRSGLLHELANRLKAETLI